MPIYEYHCSDCKITYDLNLPILQRNNKQYCKKCKTVMERKFHNIRTGLIFGKGFFKTGGY